jgi:drug/metabolite transporter (DMT)-like permease
MPIPPRRIAVLQALFVTFLWATSWVLIKRGLAHIPALTFAGLRYSLAALCLFPFTLARARRGALRHLPPRERARLVALGLVVYTLTQGAQFLALAHSPAVSVSLLLSFTPVVVLLVGRIVLAEATTALQRGGVMLGVAGALVYFAPYASAGGGWVGLAAAAVATGGNAAATLLGRSTNRSTQLSPLAITGVSMAIGGQPLLVIGMLTQGMPPLRLSDLVIVGWLAVVNTACAFTLWNHALRALSAAEASAINNTMLAQIAALAWLLLGEGLDVRRGIGALLVEGGALTAQLRHSPKSRARREKSRNDPRRGGGKGAGKEAGKEKDQHGGRDGRDDAR